MVAAGDPVESADITTITDYTTSKPLVRLLQQSAQVVSSATDTAVTFGTSSEDIDTHGFHSEVSNTSRITPTVAGYYRLTGVIVWAADTDITVLQSLITKNGITVSPRQRMVTPTVSPSSIRAGFPVTVISSANGSTDYFELFCNQLQNAAGNLSTNVSGGDRSCFECEFIRPL